MSRQTTARRSLEHFGISMLAYLRFRLGQPLLGEGDGAVKEIEERPLETPRHMSRAHDAPSLRARAPELRFKLLGGVPSENGEGKCPCVHRSSGGQIFCAAHDCLASIGFRALQPKGVVLLCCFLRIPKAKTMGRANAPFVRQDSGDWTKSCSTCPRRSARDA